MSRRSKARKRHAKQTHRRAQHVALADFARIEAPETEPLYTMSRMPFAELDEIADALQHINEENL